MQNVKMQNAKCKMAKQKVAKFKTNIQEVLNPHVFIQLVQQFEFLLQFQHVEFHELEIQLANWSNNAILKTTL